MATYNGEAHPFIFLTIDGHRTEETRRDPPIEPETSSARAARIRAFLESEAYDPNDL
jgi:hypothetical protein